MRCVATDYLFRDNKIGDTMEDENFAVLFNLTKEKLADRVRELRLQKHYTQEDLEEISGISRRGIGYIENAEVDIKLSTLLRLSESFQMTLAELLDFPEEEE